MPMQRATVQREAIRQVFSELARPLAPQEVLAEAAKRQPQIGLATIYRTIKTLVEEDWLSAVELPGEVPRYELAGKRHHHHFCCRNCAGVFDLDGCCGHVHTELPAGYVAESHEVTVYGLCPACSGTPRKAVTTRH